MACRAVLRLRQHLGRRGAFLLILGVGKVCWGVGWIAAPVTDPDGLDLLTSVAPLHCWAWLWISSGVVMLGMAWLRVGRDWAGFAIALVPPTIWALAYVVAVITGDYPRGGYVAVWYLTSHVGVILWASGVPEYSVPPTPPRARRGKGA